MYFTDQRSYNQDLLTLFHFLKTFFVLNRTDFYNNKKILKRAAHTS